jgi:hypothetical protein
MSQVNIYKPKNGYEACELFDNREKLSALELRNLRKHLKVHPDDLKGRLLMMAHLQFPKSKSGWEELVRHYIWFIENYPEHPTHLSLMFPWKAESLHFEAVSKCWKMTLSANSDNGKVLGNAGYFFCLMEPKLSHRMLKKAFKLRPKDIRILQLYYHSARVMFVFEKKPCRDVLLAGEMLFQQLKVKEHKASVAWNLLKFAAWSKDATKCKKLAKYVLVNYPKGTYFEAQARHHANFYLGWCAFISDDMRGFEHYLNLAEQIKFKTGMLEFGVIYRDLKNIKTREGILNYLQCCVDSDVGWNVKSFLRALRNNSKVDIKSYWSQEVLHDEFYNWILHY